MTGALWLLWQSVRLPVFAFLVILEPVARLVLSTLGLLCILMAFFFEYATALEHFPFWEMLGAGVACELLLAVYYGLLRVFSA